MRPFAHWHAHPFARSPIHELAHSCMRPFLCTHARLFARALNRVCAHWRTYVAHAHTSRRWSFTCAPIGHTLISMWRRGPHFTRAVIETCAHRTSSRTRPMRLFKCTPLALIHACTHCTHSGMDPSRSFMRAHAHTWHSCMCASIALIHVRVHCVQAYLPACSSRCPRPSL